METPNSVVGVLCLVDLLQLSLGLLHRSGASMASSSRADDRRTMRQRFFAPTSFRVNPRLEEDAGAS
jgi:hypothetical protein